MSSELLTAIGTIAAVFVMRLWSMYEHRGTSKKVKEIYFILNGEMKKKLEEEYERGKADAKK